MESEDYVKPFAMRGHAEIDRAASGVTDAISATEYKAEHVTHKVANKAEETASQLKPVMDNLSTALDSALQKVRGTLHDAADQLRTQIQKAADLAVGTKREPLKGSSRGQLARF